MNPIVDNFFSSGYTHGLRTTLFFEETGFVGQQLVNAEANTVFLEVIKNKEDPSNFDNGINLTVDVFTSFLEFWNRKWPQIEITMNQQISKIRKKIVNVPTESKMHVYMSGTCVFQNWFDTMYMQASKKSHDFTQDTITVHLQKNNKSMKIDPHLLTELAKNLNQFQLSVELWSIVQS